jgi:hypothetical protein
MAQVALQLEQLLVEPLDLVVALTQLGDGLLDPQLKLVVELVDARHHLVEVLGDHPELVGALDLDGGGGIAGADARDGIDEALDRAIHDVANREAHEESHDDHRGRRERQRPRASASGQAVCAVERKAAGDGAGHRIPQGDRGHHLPISIAIHEPRDDVPAPRLLEVAPRERQSAAGVARGDDAGAPRFQSVDVELDNRLANRQDPADLLIEERRIVELAAIADGRRDLAGEDDGALLHVLLDGAAREAEAQGREAERDDDENRHAQHD